MEWIDKILSKFLNIPSISIFSFSLNLNLKKDEYSEIKYNHYQKFLSLDNDFRALDKCSPMEINNIIIELCDKAQNLKDEAETLFTGKIPKLEKEIFETIKTISFECEMFEKVKGKIFNQIVRTKFKQCKKELKKVLKMKG